MKVNKSFFPNKSQDNSPFEEKHGKNSPHPSRRLDIRTFGLWERGCSSSAGNLKELRGWDDRLAFFFPNVFFWWVGLSVLSFDGFEFVYRFFHSFFSDLPSLLGGQVGFWDDDHKKTCSLAC